MAKLGEQSLDTAKRQINELRMEKHQIAEQNVARRTGLRRGHDGCRACSAD
jgi:hypothetical protein